MSGNMQFVKPSHGDLQLQRISRSTFDPRCVEHRGDVNQEKLDCLILHVRQSMPHSGLQHFWCNGPNSGSLNSTIKKVNDPTPIGCQQCLLSMKLLAINYDTGILKLLKHFDIHCTTFCFEENGNRVRNSFNKNKIQVVNIRLHVVSFILSCMHTSYG